MGKNIAVANNKAFKSILGVKVIVAAGLSYNTWVATMTPICIKDNTLVLQVKDPSTKNTLKSIYTQTLTDCINRANSGTYLVRFIDESELPLIYIGILCILLLRRNIDAALYIAF